MWEFFSKSLWYRENEMLTKEKKTQLSCYHEVLKKTQFC